MTRDIDELLGVLRAIDPLREPGGARRVLREAADAIDSLRSQPAGGRDAERYRWIRSTFNVPDPSDDPESPWAQAWDMIELGQVDGRIAAQLDDAIDAAMKESAK